MNGASKNYDYPRKRHWRRWVWNRIAERIPCHPNEAIVVGLLGKDGLDIEEAERRGFRRSNMVAVDRNVDAVKSLRKLGVTALQGNLGDVLHSWGDGPTINVLLGDFCSGLSGDALITMSSLQEHPELFKSCVMLNFLRGRDRKESNRMKSLTRDIALLSGDPDYIDPIGTHRGAFAVQELTCSIQIPPPAYTSYRSITTYFDTAVFQWLPSGKGQYQERPSQPPGLRRRIAAAKALLTQRRSRI